MYFMQPLATRAPIKSLFLSASPRISLSFPRRFQSSRGQLTTAGIEGIWNGHKLTFLVPNRTRLKYYQQITSMHHRLGAQRSYSSLSAGSKQVNIVGSERIKIRRGVMLELTFMPRVLLDPSSLMGPPVAFSVRVEVGEGF